MKDDSTHTHTHLTALFPGLPGWACTRKVKTNLDFTEARNSKWQWHQLGHIQVCTLLQTDNHTNTSSLNFYRPGALPDSQPTMSKHWRQQKSNKQKNRGNIINTLNASVPLVLWRCWLGGRKGIRPVKNWVVGCWCGYLSGATCRLAYGPADATATHCILLQ